MLLKTVLIDDELACTNSLSIELEAYCPDIQVLATFNKPDNAILFLQKEQVDIVFLDIEMGIMTGFDLLNKLKNTSFEVVFVTAHDSYAVKAFEYCAIDYLVKPVLKYRLIEAVEKIKKKRAADAPDTMNMRLLQGSIQAIHQQLPTIPIPTSDGLELIRADEIVYIEADGNYSHIFMKVAKEKYYVSKSLKEIEALLTGRNFLRTHHSFIVNPLYIKKYVRGAGGYLVMSTGQSVDVSRANKEKVVEALGG
jgi:two-component system, LytTR family, response regulator